jgi:DNA polymerase-3 subunit delta
VKDLERLVDDEMRAAGLQMERPTRAMLIALLGSDRRASRNEVRKLAAYMHGRDRVEPDDILAVVSDAAGFAMDTVADAAFAGRPADVEVEMTRVLTAGTSAGSVISAALRHTASLHKMRLALDSGAALTDAMRGVFFRRQDAIAAAVRTWTAPRLAATLTDLAAAAFAIRRNADLGEAVARRALLTIAMRARKRD